MKKIWVYNKDTHMLHIEGFCCNSLPCGKETFRTLEDVYQKYGRNIIVCKICDDKIEKILHEHIENKE